MISERKKINKRNVQIAKPYYMERDFSLSHKQGDRHSLQDFLIEEINLRVWGEQRDLSS